ncbi:MAG: cytochrome c oxidase subunit II [Pseudomonadales bacterium]|nr:cytochrome c oxidase subunit II [Pseudomonadales bacterium]
MEIALVLVLIVVATVIFHWLSPWWLTEPASNWGEIDAMLIATLVITSFFFITINLFIAYCLWRFRHKSDDQRAAFQPENKKLEWALTLFTTVGISAMLAPGLWVYSDFVTVPKEASPIEVVGQQWQWSYRLPGKDGQLGKSDISLINAKNPLGLDSQDKHALDDILILNGPLMLPVHETVQVFLRSKDVLHDFYVPEFRVKMDLVPGLVSSFWFTPTRTGSFDVLCAELCGVGHYNMRSKITITSPDNYQSWLATQPTFQRLLNQQSRSLNQVEQGKELAQQQGCLACHSVDGSASVGPGWLNLYGKQEELTTGEVVQVDDDYLKRAITAPNTQIVTGFAAIMPAMPLDEKQLTAIIAYIKSLSDKSDIQQDKEVP